MRASRFHGTSCLAVTVIILSATAAPAEPGVPRRLTLHFSSQPVNRYLARGQQMASCLFKIYREGDPVLGGYRRGDRDPGDFDPNSGPHGPHVTPEILKNRMYYYYFEVQALVASIGNRDDWSFNQALDRSGWLTLDLGQQKETARLDMALHHAADNADEGDFAWDTKGYHYGSAHGIPIQWPDTRGASRAVKNADIVWKFTLTGYHDTGSGRDTICAPLTFSIHLVIKLGSPVWTVQSGLEGSKPNQQSH